MPYKLDTDTQIFFYEQEFYVLSNFSSFAIDFMGERFPTAEHLYHWFKFPKDFLIQGMVKLAPSAHEAFKIAQEHKDERTPDWDQVKCYLMKSILEMKVNQHEYVEKKLRETGNRELIEDSWRDDYWGWGPNKGGQNMLGKLWMEVRSELR